MKKRLSARILVIAIIIPVLLASCGSPAPLVAPTAQSQIQQPSQPTATSTLPAATLFVPSILGTPLPSGLVPINGGQATQLLEIAEYGKNPGILYSGDGKRKLVSQVGGGDLFDTQSDKLIAHLEYDRVLALSPDGTTILVQDPDGVWSLSDAGERVNILAANQASVVQSASISPDGKWALFGVGFGSYRSAYVIDLSSKKIVYGDYSNVSGAFSNGGKYFTRYDMYRHQMDFYQLGSWQTPSFSHVVAGGIVMSSDDSLIADGSADGVQIFSVPDMKPVRKINQKWMPGFIMKFSDGNSSLAILEPGRRISIWNVVDGSLIAQQDSVLSDLSSANITSAGEVVNTAKSDETKLPWSFSIGLRSGLAFSKDGSELHFVNDNQGCSLPLQGKPTCQTVDRGYSVPILRQVVVGSDGELYTTVLNGTVLSMYKGIGEQENSVFKVNAAKALELHTLAVVPQQPFVVYSLEQYASGYPYFENIARNITTEKGRSKWGTPVYTTEGLYLPWSVSTDGITFAVLNPEKNQPEVMDTLTLVTRTMAPHPEEAGLTSIVESALALSPDGKALAYLVAYIKTIDTTRDSNGTPVPVKKYEAQSFKLILADATSGTNNAVVDFPFSTDKYQPPIQSFLGITPYFTSLVYSPDGKMLAFGAMDGSIYLLDAMSGEVILKTQSDGPVYRLAFSPDGKMLASAQGLRGIRVWGIIPGVMPPTPKPTATTAIMTATPIPNTATSTPVPNTATARPMPEQVPGTIELTFGVPQAGKGINVYTFSGNEGQKISIIMNKTSGESSFPSLNLTDDVGKSLKSDVACCQDAAAPKSWWQTQAAILDFPLPYTGTYYIKTSMLGRAGNYSLQVDLSK